MIEYNTDATPLGVRGSFEQHVASIHRRELARFTRRAFTHSIAATLGIIIGRFVA